MSEKEKKTEGQTEGKNNNQPTMDFTTFILSLTSSVQVHLGLVPNPVTQKTETDLLAARQTIDIMDMLQEKTKGNLSKEEQRLLEYVLYDLRMKYVELNKNA